MPGALSFSRSLLLLLAFAASASAIEYGVRDPEFSRVPFDEWLAAGKGDRVNWSVDLRPAELSTHQRMLQAIYLTVDGRELEKRRGDGEFITFIQYQDASGHVWQDHTLFDLAKLRAGMETQNIVIGEFAFIMPGDYSVALALWHSSSGMHTVIRRHVRVRAVSNDPLPESWARLPTVEFIPVAEVPDNWYLPGVRESLNLPVTTKRRVQVHLVVNATPSQRSAGSVTALRRDMSLLIPALKALTAMRLQDGSIDVRLLDLMHRKVAFEQKDVSRLDWRRMREFFIEAKPGMVDVQTLAGEWKMRPYFRERVGSLMSLKDGAAHLVIVLSGPAFMDGQEVANEPWEPPDADHRLIYIRYRPDPLRFRAQSMMRPGARPTPPVGYRPMSVDDLERTVEPLHPRIFDATSTEQFRRVMAAVIEEIAHF